MKIKKIKKNKFLFCNVCELVINFTDFTDFLFSKFLLCKKINLKSYSLTIKNDKKS